MRAPRVRAVWTSAGAAGFVALMSVAVALYPRDHLGRGYDFWGYYWCDLFDGVSEGGQQNPGQWWAVGGTAALALGLGPQFWSLRREFRGAVAALGLLGCFGIAAVPAVTALGWGDLHRVLILWTGPPGLLGLVLAIFVQQRRGHVMAARAGYALLALGGWNFIQYARQAVFETARWQGLPAVQKAATAALLAWLLMSTWLPARRHVGK